MSKWNRGEGDESHELIVHEMHPPSRGMGGCISRATYDQRYDRLKDKAVIFLSSKKASKKLFEKIKVYILLYWIKCSLNE